MRRYGGYLLLLFPGVLALGCGGSSSNPTDARYDTTGPIDGSVERVGDAAFDARTDGAPDVAVAPDAGIDVGGDTVVRPDTPADTRIDVIVADAPADGRDVAADARDVARDVPVIIDGAVSDTGQSDGPSQIGEVGGVDAAPLGLLATPTGAQVVPPVNTPATATATFALSPDNTQVTYHITQTVTGATTVAIYMGAAGTNGSQVFPITPVSADMTGSFAVTPAQVDSLESGMMYVLITSATNPNGELRGQILLPGQSLWVANLTGPQMVPPVTSTATGQAAFVLSADQTILRYHLTTTGITATVVSIARGMAGMAATQLHQLTPVAATMDGVVVLSPAELQELMQKHLSIIVSTAGNGNGELRGQLLMPGETLYAAVMSGSQEVPSVNPSATGAAQLVLDPSATKLSYELVWSDLTGPATAAHIHTGAVGVNGPVLYPLTLNPTGSGAAGTLTLTPSDLIALNGGQLYVNAHTAANPAGELRGQITKP